MSESSNCGWFFFFSIHIRLKAKFIKLVREEFTEVRIMADEDIYSGEGREELVDDDEISPTEEGFMEGAHDGGQGAKCRRCGKILDDDFIERKFGDEILRFCSDECVQKYSEKQE
jgi:hypothetical protein